MCALSYFLERAGLMTTGISLVRENAESMLPPRTLWVSFPLGRPLGKPGDPEFQHKVIGHALDLLERPSGPVLEDFPEDVPMADPETAPACPVSFTQPHGPTDTRAGSWEDRLERDLAAVLPWYELSQRRRGRTLVGVAEGSPEENIAAIGRLLDEGELPLTSLKWFKHAVEDLKVLYVEALTAQPGEHDYTEVQRVLWQETVFGAALIEFYHKFQQSQDKRIAMIARILVPRAAVAPSKEGG